MRHLLLILFFTLNLAHAENERKFLSGKSAKDTIEVLDLAKDKNPDPEMQEKNLTSDSDNSLNNIAEEQLTTVTYDIYKKLHEEGQNVQSLNGLFCGYVKDLAHCVFEENLTLDQKKEIFVWLQKGTDYGNTYDFRDAHSSQDSTEPAKKGTVIRVGGLEYCEQKWMDERQVARTAYVFQVLDEGTCLGRARTSPKKLSSKDNNN